ncbi:hypothetical protein Tco_0787740 [Tanacetum coccineum]
MNSTSTNTETLIGSSKGNPKWRIPSWRKQVSKLGIEQVINKINIERHKIDAADYYFKEDYTNIPSQSRLLQDKNDLKKAVIYRDRDDNKKMMRIDEMHKFSDGTLMRIRDKLDFMVKDFRLFKFNKGMETRKWTEDEKRRSEDFIEVIEKRLKIRRIFRSLESFVGGQLRDIDYRLIIRTDTLPILLSFTHCGNKSILRVLRIILVILPEHPSETKVFHNEDGNPARANIKQALGSYERSHKGVKASASAQDGDPLQDDEKDGVIVSSFVKSMKSCFGGMMVSFGLFDGLEMEAFGDAMEVDNG